MAKIMETDSMLIARNYAVFAVGESLSADDGSCVAQNFGKKSERTGEEIGQRVCIHKMEGKRG